MIRLSLLSCTTAAIPNPSFYFAASELGVSTTSWILLAYSQKHFDHFIGQIPWTPAQQIWGSKPAWAWILSVEVGWSRIERTLICFLSNFSNYFWLFESIKEADFWIESNEFWLNSNSVCLTLPYSWSPIEQVKFKLIFIECLKYFLLTFQINQIANFWIESKGIQVFEILMKNLSKYTFWGIWLKCFQMWTPLVLLSTALAFPF